MSRKTPSSLDYETLLHELALRSWRRAMMERDFARALQSAERLFQSRDPFWRWQGALDRALVHLARGEARSSLEALAAAKEVYRDTPALIVPALEIEAHLVLETGDRRRAIELAGAAAFETPVLSYLKALASVGPGALPPEAQWLPISEPAGILSLYPLASKLAEDGNREKALELFEEISSRPDALLYWPIPYVRSFASAARLHALRGDELAARASWETFLSYWKDGDLDRDLVEEGVHFVKA